MNSKDIENESEIYFEQPSRLIATSASKKHQEVQSNRPSSQQVQ